MTPGNVITGRSGNVLIGFGIVLNIGAAFFQHCQPETFDQGFARLVTVEAHLAGCALAVGVDDIVSRPNRRIRGRDVNREPQAFAVARSVIREVLPNDIIVGRLGFRRARAARSVTLHDIFGSEVQQPAAGQFLASVLGRRSLNYDFIEEMKLILEFEILRKTEGKRLTDAYVEVPRDVDGEHIINIVIVIAEIPVGPELVIDDVSGDFEPFAAKHATC